MDILVYNVHHVTLRSPIPALSQDIFDWHFDVIFLFYLSLLIRPVCDDALFSIVTSYHYNIIT